ncbi:MAG: hypothetical protein ABEJ98_02065 [Candidatus Nanohaloarchaea archaeon]
MKKGKLMLDDSFEERLDQLKSITKENKNKSASEIIEDEEAIQEAKKKSYQSDV